MSNQTVTLPEKNPVCVRILCLGDVSGRPGRQILASRLPTLRKDLSIDMVIANGENAAGGVGLTPETFRELIAAGVDVVTGGNHIWKHQELYPLLINDPRLIRPANYPPGAPGRGLCIHTLAQGTRVAVMNLIGRVFMEPLDCPFQAATALLTKLEQEEGPLIRIVDFHAEASSEKRALAHVLDGRVSAVLGTHTHVQTADARIAAQGTASLTDLGMCGVEDDSILGVAVEPVVARFVRGLPVSFRPAKGTATLNGALLDIDKETGRTIAMRLMRGQGELFTPPGVPSS